MESSQKTVKMYECKDCGYVTSKVGNWKKHLLTKKHIEKSVQATSTATTKKKPSNALLDDPSLVCECGRRYKHRQSLHTHRKRCQGKPADSQALQDVADRLDSTMREMARGLSNMSTTDKAGVTNNYTGDNMVVGDQNISINLFLNEHCKNAMSIQTFMSQLVLTLGDLEKGKGDGIASTIVQNLKPLDAMQRPIHCANMDGQWFVKNEEKGWLENDGTDVIRCSEQAIAQRWPSDFDAAHPGWIRDEHLQDKYVAMSSALMAELSTKEKEELLAAVAREVHIDSAIVKSSAAKKG